MFKLGSKIKVVKLNNEKMMNLWGGYDDLSSLLNKEGVITSIISPDTKYEKYGVEFEDFKAQITRERTGYILDQDEIILL